MPSRMRTLRLFVVFLLVLILLSGGGFYFWILKDLPNPAQFTENVQPPSVRIVDRQGRLLYEVLPKEGGRHTSLPLQDIPLTLQQAVIATEDRYFYQNPGVDWRGMLRALWINLRGGEALAGGSTITQQVARNLLLTPAERAERSIRRKLRESLLAWQLARRYPKDEVLALYLNQTYFGNLAYGVEAAAQTYFGKPVSQLDLAECALLAGLPQAPAAYDPFTHPAAAKERQKTVLELMEKSGFITAEQRQQAEQEPLIFASQSYPMEAPHFVLWVRAQMDALIPPQQLRKAGGWTVQTTLDLDLQRIAEKAVRDQLKRLREQTLDPFGHNVNNAALVALDPHSGGILAMVGSPDYNDAEHAGALNMALALRQPGSALKPLIYAAAFDPQRPNPWTPATMILDVTTHFTTHEGKSYTPVNYDGLEHGPVLVREALASSLNIPAVIALDHLGIAELYAFASRLGITTLGDPRQADLSVALGGGEVTLLELTAAYGAFASGGYRVQPFAIQSITDAQGSEVYRHTPPAPQRVLDERVAWLISDILSDDHARTLGFGRNSVLKLDRPAAVKTGTTTNFHDNWAIGYTPSLVLGVWAGNASHEAMHNISGLTGAAPIWAQAMRAMLAGTPEEPFQRPPGLTRVEVCALSGLLPTPACPNRKLEWFIEGTQPTQKDTFYRLVELDTASGKLANASTPTDRRRQVLALDLPPQAQPWARQRKLLLWDDLTASAETAAEQAAPALQILFPPPNGVFYLSNSLPAETQRIRLQAAGSAGLRQVVFWVNGIQAGQVNSAPFECWWRLEKGQHQVWVVGVWTNGQTLTSERVTFEVR